MAIYQFSSDNITAVPETTFATVGFSERNDIQRLLRDNIQIVDPDVLIISEEFGEWDDSRRRIDLLGIDTNANLVVLELKRTEDGGHMELQAVRYAAMVSTLTFERAVEIFDRYLNKRDDDRDPRKTILDFLGWESPEDDEFAASVRIVLVSAEFSKELTTSVMWLSDFGIDVRCVRIKPYGERDSLFVDVQQVIPLPEAEEYQIRVREKEQLKRSQKWTPKTEQQIWAEFESQCEPATIELVRQLKQWIEPLVDEVFATRLGFAQQLSIGNTKYFFFKIKTDGSVRLSCQYFASKPPFTDVDVQDELVRRLNEIPGFEITHQQLTGRPKLPIAILENAKAMQTFQKTVEWLIEQARSQAPTT